MKKAMIRILLLDKNKTISEKRDVSREYVLIFLFREDKANGISLSVFTHKDK